MESIETIFMWLHDKMCVYDQDPEYGNACKPNTKGKGLYLRKIELQYFSEYWIMKNKALLKNKESSSY